MNTATLMVAVILLAGVLLARANRRLGFPALISFVAVGAAMAALMPSLLENVTPTVAKNLSYVAMAMILFEGGLHTSMRRVRRALAPALSLATIGVIVAAALMTLCVHLILKLPWLPCAMLGVAASSTDAASVFSVLGNTSLRGRLADVLEVESGTNDPMTFFLMTVLIQWSQTGIPHHSSGLLAVIDLFLLQMGMGILVGVMVGWAGRFLLTRVDLDAAGLYPTLSLAIALLSFALAQSFHGSGFLAVYTTGVVIASGRLEQRFTVVRFHEGLAWTMHVLMFVVLGFFLVPRDFVSISVQGVLLAFAAISLARPVAVWLATFGMGFSAEEKWFLAWAGLRGAAPIVLILSAVEAQVTGYIVLIEIVFFIVIASTLIQGLTVQWLAEKFELVAETPSESIFDLMSLTRETAVVVPVEIGMESQYVNVRLQDIPFPDHTLCYGVVRGAKAIVPRGHTRLRVGDHLLILAEACQIGEINRLFASEPVGDAAMLP
ncbi:K+/H+ antiporter [Alicyclobacillus hesperidum subsp. aegles]|uniref:potassium/proton antiporter n=1 Tax=Alicyclobacillus hesperidum TaxID=89784 RepID=UPI00222892C3|nr:potassium/proton antiporter [Alicyclobacillus hesperidum]GLG01291.1 K+/H+ antiporter [Alicyclobacillus hesperidum subsp. aegles]